MADKAPKGIWNSYEKKGDKVVRKNKSCPKCGTGFALAAHKDRLTCGACHYTEFAKKEKPAEKPKEVKKEAPKKEEKPKEEKKEKPAEPKKEEKPAEKQEEKK